MDLRKSGLRVRPAQLTDIPTLSKWDRETHVIKATTDSPEATVAFDENHDWKSELESQNEFSIFYIAEFNEQPFGALQIIDPHNEETHYWGEVEEDLRAIDIWIGEQDFLGKGFGTKVMNMVIEYCFESPKVKAIVIDPLYSNTSAHRFYQRLGFVPVERKLFNGDDDCLVHRLDRDKRAVRHT